jgi:hypothetical protein
VTQRKPDRHPRRGSENRQRIRQVAVRLTEAEYAALTRAATQAGTTAPDMLRETFLTTISKERLAGG